MKNKKSKNAELPNSLTGSLLQNDYSDRTNNGKTHYKLEPAIFAEEADKNTPYHDPFYDMNLAAQAASLYNQPLNDSREEYSSNVAYQKLGDSESTAPRRCRSFSCLKSPAGICCVVFTLIKIAFLILYYFKGPLLWSWLDQATGG